MRKTSFEYHIHGYRYAPESFHIYKGLPGQEKTELPLSDEQRYQMGYLYLTQGIKSAVDYVKHIERERERKAITGNCLQIRCSALVEKRQLFNGWQDTGN